MNIPYLKPIIHEAMLNTAMYSRIVVKLQGMMYRATQLLKQLNTNKSNLKLIKNLFELKKKTGR